MTFAAEKTDATTFNHTDTLCIFWLSQKMRISTAFQLILNNTMNPRLTESLWIPKPLSSSFNKLSYQSLQCQSIVKPNQKDSTTFKLTESAPNVNLYFQNHTTYFWGPNVLHPDDIYKHWWTICWFICKYGVIFIIQVLYLFTEPACMGVLLELAKLYSLWMHAREKKKPGVGLGYRSRSRDPNLKSYHPKNILGGGGGEEKKVSQQRHLKTFAHWNMLVQLTTPEYPFFTETYMCCHIRHCENPYHFCTSVLYSVWNICRSADTFCLHCNIFIYIRHIWIKLVLCSHMVSLFHHTSPWTHRCLQSKPSAHWNGRVFSRSVQRACCYCYS
jgi:hypothetical protein